MPDSDIALVAHLMRRAGVGATRDELEEYAAKGYEAVVDDLLHPERFPENADIVDRYYGGESIFIWAGTWIYRMASSRRPLEEKMALFWHHLFATAWYKGEHTTTMFRQIDMFRKNGLSDIRTILTDLSKDPAMIFWLDNNENKSGEPNENYGRELLELFSMGVGNYSEQDIKMAARAFTGWTFEQPIPLYPHGNYDTPFLFREDQHDDSVKTFLGETGRFNGEDIIDIVVRQPATARFVSRHLYNFFVADEPQVPAWEQVPPQDPKAVDALSEAYVDSGGDVRAMMRVMFNSDFFKEARFQRVKSPAELVAGVLKLVGTHRFPRPGIIPLSDAAAVMGQQLLNPPTVEGWHTGKEWIDGGTLNERINFAVNEVADISKPGIQEIIGRLGAGDAPLSPEDLVDQCLDLAGPVEVEPDTREALVASATSGGDLRFGTEEEKRSSAERAGRMLQLIVASREYQFA